MLEAFCAKIPRGKHGGYAIGVIKSWHGRPTVFHKSEDYEAFFLSREAVNISG
jgi:hypothetical protein